MMQGNERVLGRGKRITFRQAWICATCGNIYPVDIPSAYPEALVGTYEAIAGASNIKWPDGDTRSTRKHGSCPFCGHGALMVKPDYEVGREGGKKVFWKKALVCPICRIARHLET